MYILYKLYVQMYIFSNAFQVLIHSYLRCCWQKKKKKTGCWQFLKQLYRQHQQFTVYSFTFSIFSFPTQVTKIVTSTFFTLKLYYSHLLLFTFFLQIQKHIIIINVMQEGFSSPGCFPAISRFVRSLSLHLWNTSMNCF